MFVNVVLILDVDFLSNFIRIDNFDIKMGDLLGSFSDEHFTGNFINVKRTWKGLERAEHDLALFYVLFLFGHRIGFLTLKLVNESEDSLEVKLKNSFSKNGLINVFIENKYMPLMLTITFVFVKIDRISIRDLELNKVEDMDEHVSNIIVHLGLGVT